jgi:putative N6-adenine-specific DNA methylase
MGKAPINMNIRYMFATTAKGVEEVLAQELKRLEVKDILVEKGGVRFSGDLKTCYMANLWLRTAQRILIYLDDFLCDTPQHLYDGIRSINWREFINPDMTMAVDCNLRDSNMTHSGFAALKSKDAIVDSIRDACGRRPYVDVRNPDLRINLHIFRNHCTVSLDSSGISLDKRGYRVEAGDAPLRETLAAALVDLSGWNGTVPLIDPMCGSGTILIEAAMKAAGMPPGFRRSLFGFQRWPSYDDTVWNWLLKEAKNQLSERISSPVLGFDVSSKLIEKAKNNANRAGVENFIVFEKRDIVDMQSPDPPGIVLFNPPYGVRLGEMEALRNLYKHIGDTLKNRCKGYNAYLFTGNPELAKSVGLKASRKIVLFNGPIECRLLKYELY